MSVVDGIDHVILAVSDLDVAAVTYNDLLGLWVSGGGSHPTFGTANRIVVLGDDYLELIVATPEALASSWLRDRVRQVGEGCAGYALACSDPQNAARHLREAGILVGGPQPGRLEAANGFSRGWRSVGFQALGSEGLPFLIQHDTRGEERRRLLAGIAGLRPHALGARSLAAVTVAVADLDAACDRYARLFDLVPGTPEHDPMLQATCARLPLPSGADIILAAPYAPDRGPVATSLRADGEGLFAITIAVDELQAAVNALRARGIGVRVDEPDGVLVAAQLHMGFTHGARIGLVAAQH